LTTVQRVLQQWAL